MSFVANSILPLSAAVSYYGGGITGMLERAKDQHGPILFFWGGLDKHIKHEHIESVVAAMMAAEKPYINVEISYADHAFNCDARANYHPEAAREAWAMATNFLRNKLGA